jgi:hypothetical protein
MGVSSNYMLQNQGDYAACDPAGPQPGEMGGVF